MIVPTVFVDVTESTLDERGRLTLPKELRERYGERYHLVRLPDGIKLIPIAEDPLEALREEFDGIEKGAEELREEARDGAISEAGR